MGFFWYVLTTLTHLSSYTKPLKFIADFTRNLHLLLHPDSPAAPRRIATASHGISLSSRHIGLHCRRHDRPCHLPHRPRLGNAYIDARLSHRLYSCRNNASRSTLLEPGFHPRSHHTLGNGHEFPSRHVNHERCSREEASGYGRKSCQYCGELQH
jgi:hypothetical protein